MSDTVSQIDMESLPYFITPPGETDQMMLILAISMPVILLVFGAFFLHLHSVPDRMAHKASHNQLQLIGILTLLALFTHNNVLWLLALIVAALNPPDLLTPLRSMARSLARLSRRADGNDRRGSAPQDIGAGEDA